MGITYESVGDAEPPEGLQAGFDEDVAGAESSVHRAWIWEGNVRTLFETLSRWLGYALTAPTGQLAIQVDTLLELLNTTRIQDNQGT